MTFECLPMIVKECLLSLARERGFSEKGDVILGQEVHGDISSSCQVAIREENNELVFFIKYFIRKDSDPHLADGLMYYNNETVFYGEIYPLFKEIANKIECHFTPNCLYIEGVQNKQPFMVMEDLTSSGYIPFKVRESISLEQAREIVIQLGKFHAFSFAAKDQRPQMFSKATSKLLETVFRPDTGATMTKIFIRSIHDAYKLTKQSLPVDSVYVEKFAAFTLNVYDRISFLINGGHDNEYKVLTHGDLWISNVLSRKGAEDCDVIFVDFQGCRLASPVHDLMFIILVALDKLTRDLHREELIRHYHTSLCRTLQALGSDPLRLFPYSALDREIHRQSQLVLSLALTGLPLHLHEQDISLLIDPTNHPNDERNVEDFFEFLLHNKSMKCKNKMLEIIMDCVDNGYI